MAYVRRKRFEARLLAGELAGLMYPRPSAAGSYGHRTASGDVPGEPGELKGGLERMMGRMGARWA
jgi:hypothetical protein